MDNKNKPVFPIYNKEFIRENDQSNGLTKRELFAAMALQGFLSNIDGLYSSNDIVDDSIQIADKLLKALEEPND